MNVGDSFSGLRNHVMSGDLSVQNVSEDLPHTHTNARMAVHKVTTLSLLHSQANPPSQLGMRVYVPPVSWE